MKTCSICGKRRKRGETAPARVDTTIFLHGGMHTTTGETEVFVCRSCYDKWEDESNDCDDISVGGEDEGDSDAQTAILYGWEPHD